MTGQEAEELFNGIMENLRQRHLSKIISLIEEQIAEGKIIDDEVKTFREDLSVVQNALPTIGLGTNHLKLSSKSLFSTVVPYTSKECLTILVNIIEQTLSAPLEIRGYLTTSFLEKRSLTKLEFASPEGEALVSVDQQDPFIHEQVNFASKLRKTLDIVRGEL